MVLVDMLFSMLLCYNEYSIMRLNLLEVESFAILGFLGSKQFYVVSSRAVSLF